MKRAVGDRCGCGDRIGEGVSKPGAESSSSDVDSHRSLGSRSPSNGRTLSVMEASSGASGRRADDDPPLLDCLRAWAELRLA